MRGTQPVTASGTAQLVMLHTSVSPCKGLIAQFKGCKAPVWLVTPCVDTLLWLYLCDPAA
jgi:hypothetical protein